MSGHTKACRNCGGTQFEDNNGIDHKTAHAGAHLGFHNVMHGHPALAAVGLTAAVIGLAFPKKLTCTACRHVVKA